MKQQFTYNNKIYELRDGELYRLPYKAKDGRNMRELKCKRWKDGWILGSSQKSLAQVMEMVGKRTF